MCVGGCVQSERERLEETQTDEKKKKKGRRKKKKKQNKTKKHTIIQPYRKNEKTKQKPNKND